MCAGASVCVCVYVCTLNILYGEDVLYKYFNYHYNLHTVSIVVDMCPHCFHWCGPA